MWGLFGVGWLLKCEEHVASNNQLFNLDYQVVKEILVSIYWQAVRKLLKLVVVYQLDVSPLLLRRALP